MAFLKKFLCSVIWSAILIVVPVQCAILFERQCQWISQSECATFFNGTELTSEAPMWYATFPNARHLSLKDALTEFGHFYPLFSLNNYCSYLLHVFLCIHYFPPCNPALNCKEIVMPCRAVCEEAMAECLDYVYEHYYYYGGDQSTWTV